MKRKWELATWTTEWKQRYENEAEILKEIFQFEMLEIHHVGSTSVPSIGYAKPIIDILIIITDIEKVSLYNEQMITAGYKVRGENGIPNRRYFTKGDYPRTHHVHIYQYRDAKITTYLDFKTFLIEHPQKAEMYGQLKLSILESYSYDEYQLEKEKRMNKLIEEALRWGEHRRNNNS
ncbi:MAG: GrpB family protein [Candidatus Pristimantibacillus sp.]